MIYKKKENNLALILLISIIIGICFACDSHKKETKTKYQNIWATRYIYQEKQKYHTKIVYIIKTQT